MLIEFDSLHDSALFKGLKKIHISERFFALIRDTSQGGGRAENTQEGVTISQIRENCH